MKIKKLLPTLGALSAIVVAAPVFGSCSEKEPIDEWIDASIDVDTTGFKKIEGQDLEKDEALDLYIKAISDDPSIIENDIRWGHNTLFKFNEKEEGYISQKMFYKYSNVGFDKKTNTISLNFSFDYWIKIASEGWDFDITFFNLDIEYKKIPITINSMYSYLGLHLIMTEADSWLDDSYVKANGNVGHGYTKNGITNWVNLCHTLDNALITKANHDIIDHEAIQLLENPANWPSYYFSDCNKD